MNFTLTLLRVLPKNLLSALFGKAAAVRLPSRLNLRLLRWFSDRYRVRIDEAALPLESYPSLLDFFVRDLKDGLRPIGSGLVSPVDGTVSRCEVIRQGTLIQAKGLEYPVAEFLGDADLARSYEGGYAITIYLAPGDYHHIHSPVTGTISGYIAIPGTLWPVNEGSVNAIPKLFCKNERVISLIQSRDFGRVAVVKVGATNVGSISLEYDTFVANRLSLREMLSPRRTLFRKLFPDPFPVRAGERIATFRLGSTVVLLMEPGSFLPGDGCRAGAVRYGNPLGFVPR